MSALCLYSCGNYTDHPDGVCIKCRTSLNPALRKFTKPDKITIEKERIAVEEKTDPIKAKKKCKKCGAMARSNAQPVCLECREPFVKKAVNPGSKPKKERNKYTKKQKEPEVVQVVHEGNSTDRIYQIDLSRYPKIVRFINALDEIPASDMLTLLVKSRLQYLEENISL